jgi:ribosomal-protein-serine acetyltransferase
MHTILVDDRTRLRLLQVDHAPALFSLADRNRARLSEWLPWMLHTHDAADTENFIRASLEQYAAREGFHAGIWHDGELCGAVGLHRIDWPNRSVSLGYWIAQDKQGLGIVTRSVAALVGHCFDELALHRVEIRCGAENRRSRAIPVRLGFREEGVLRDAQWLGDRFSDMVVYSRLRTDEPKRV